MAREFGNMMTLNLTKVTDKPTRDALEEVRDSFNEQDLILGSFKLYTVTTTGAVSNLVVSHTLGFTPMDIIVTRLSGGTVTWSYDSFTKDKLVLSTSAAVSVRFLAGRVEQ